MGELEALGVKTIPPELPSNMAELGGDRGGDRDGSVMSEGALDTAPEVAITRTRLLEMRTLPERGGYTPLLAAIEYVQSRFRRFRQGSEFLPRPL